MSCRSRRWSSGEHGSKPVLSDAQGDADMDLDSPVALDYHNRAPFTFNGET